jgi:hypothetical protein
MVKSWRGVSPEGRELINSTMIQKQPCLHRKKGSGVVSVFMGTDILEKEENIKGR